MDIFNADVDGSANGCAGYAFYPNGVPLGRHEMIRRTNIIQFERRRIHGAPDGAGIALRLALLAASLVISLAVCYSIFH